MESAVSGLVAALQGYRIFSGRSPIDFTDETITGALCRHVSVDFGEYVPMNSNFGLLAPLDVAIRDKAARKMAYAERAVDKIKNLLVSEEV